MLRETKFGLNQIVTECPPNLRITVAVALVVQGSGLLIVCSRRDPICAAWNFPQGGVGRETLVDAALREIEEEVGIAPNQININRLSLVGFMVNKISEERKFRTGDRRDKAIFYLVAPLQMGRGHFRLNEENKNYAVVYSEASMMAKIGYHPYADRSHKVSAARCVASRARELKLLDWDLRREQLAAD